MAKYKRMINCDFVNASSFKIKVSNKAKLLYFFILTNADDKGFVDNVDELIELLNSNDYKFNTNESVELFNIKYEDALKELIDKGFLYLFEDNHENKILLIKHWYLHNQIPSSRVRESSYEKYLENIYISEEKKYERKASDEQMQSKCKASDEQLLSQNKVNKSKVNKNKTKENEINTTTHINNMFNYDDEELHNSDEFDYKKIPENWDAFNTSKAVELYVKQKNGETLDVNQTLFLNAFMESSKKEDDNSKEKNNQNDVEINTDDMPF